MVTKKKQTDDKNNQREKVSDDMFIYERRYLSEDEIISIGTQPVTGENAALLRLNEIRSFIDLVNAEFRSNLKKINSSDEEEKCHPFHESRIDWCAKRDREETSGKLKSDTAVLGYLEPTFREIIDSGKLSADLFVDIFEMGRAWERLNTRFLNKHRQRRRAEQAGARKAGENRLMVDHTDLIEWIEKYHKEHPKANKTKIVEEAAEYFGVTTRTIYNRLK